MKKMLKCPMCKKAEVQVGTIRIACYVGNLQKPMHIIKACSHDSLAYKVLEIKSTHGLLKYRIDYMSALI